MLLSNSPKENKLIAELLSAQKSCVLATCQDLQPYTSLMAYIHTKDLKNLYIATLRQTAKYKNMLENPNVALLVDNRQNSDSDISQALALTILGSVSEVPADKYSHLRKLYLNQHPQLQEFISSPDCAMLMVRVKTYKLVSDFEQVMEVEID